MHQGSMSAQIIWCPLCYRALDKSECRVDMRHEIIHSADVALAGTAAGADRQRGLPENAPHVHRHQQHDTRGVDGSTSSHRAFTSTQRSAPVLQHRGGSCICGTICIASRRRRVALLSPSLNSRSPAQPHHPQPCSGARCTVDVIICSLCCRIWMALASRAWWMPSSATASALMTGGTLSGANCFSGTTVGSM